MVVTAKRMHLRILFLLCLRKRCYWGRPDPPTNENWAFAFSCKKQWKGKAKDDVKKIANLDNKFKRVYFISNQFIRDKTRADEELRLNHEYKIDVHILDRTWIITKVFEHKHEEMAIDSLGIDVLKKEKPQLGPNDTSRQLEYDRFLNYAAPTGDLFGKRLCPCSRLSKDCSNRLRSWKATS